MSTMIEDFKGKCEGLGLSPKDVLREAGVHPSLWWKWRTGNVSPTLKSFERVLETLHDMSARKGAA